MSGNKTTRCIVCGKEIVQKSIGRRRKYCDKKCSREYHKQRKVNRTKLEGGQAKCEQCGKEYTREDKSTRKCCSLLCEHAWGRREEIEDIRKIAREEKSKDRNKELRILALELNNEGYSRKAITEALKLSKHTMERWIKNYAKDENGNWIIKTKRRQSTGWMRMKKDKAMYYSYEEAENAEEWLSLLRQGMTRWECLNEPMLAGRKTYIVCGTVNINKGENHLSIIIQSKLKMNPKEGSVYVFCGKKRDKIRYIYWDGGGFNVISQQREIGKYPWPSPKVGLAFSINPKDFELITQGKSRKKERQDWDFLDVPKEQNS